MVPNMVKLEIDPFYISYNSEYLPLSPTEEPRVIHDIRDYIVFDFLSCIEPLLMGEIYSFNFIDDPHTLIFIPWGGETTLILQTKVVEYFKNEQSITVSTSELLFAILQVAKKTYDDVSRPFIEDDTREQILSVYKRLKNLVYMFGYNYPE